MSLTNPEAVRGEDGHLYLPATRRKDGSWRPQRRVKDDYVPPELVPKFETTADRMRARGPPGMVYKTPDDSKNATEKILSKAAKTRARKREKKRLEGQAETGTPETENQLSVDTISEEMFVKITLSPDNDLESEWITVSQKTTAGCLSDRHTPNQLTQTAATSGTHTSSDPSKQLRNLRKKMRDIDALKEKIENGEIEPTPDQLAKVSRRKEVALQLAALE